MGAASAGCGVQPRRHSTWFWRRDRSQPTALRQLADPTAEPVKGKLPKIYSRELIEALFAPEDAIDLVKGNAFPIAPPGDPPPSVLPKRPRPGSRATHRQCAR